MRIVMIDELSEEMKLAREVMDPETCRVLLGVGSTNLLRYVDRLRRIGVSYLYVQDAISEDVNIAPAIREELRINAEKALMLVYSRLQLEQSPEYTAVIDMIRDMIQEMLCNKDIVVNVYELRGNGGDFFGHSVNVAFLSLLMAKNFHYDDEKMRKLGMGALLHDIGVAGMPKSLLQKRQNLNAEEQLLYEQHPVIGYHLVKDSWQISALSRAVILSHHERSDGSGYPRHLLKGDIHEFSRIVGLADCFEHLTGGHPFSTKMNLSEAVELLHMRADDWFDIDMVNKFLQRIPLFQIGTTVHLNDGRTALVISQNKGFPTRPVVRIFQDGAGNKIDPGLEVNLLENNHILIR